MLNISPLVNEWLRAVIMPGAGILMFFLGRRISELAIKWRIGLSVAAVLLAVTAGTAHYHPVRSLVGSAAERVGGESGSSHCCQKLAT